jgi:hydroxyacylglutathione hydrolase
MRRSNLRFSGSTSGKVFLATAVLIALASTIVWQRHYLMLNVMASGEPPALLETSAEHISSRWYDEYFIVENIDERTFAIGEPLYYQQNFSYLIVGSERAVLFDAGPGYRDIRAVAESLTELPITFVPSHFHYDHTGNQVTFERVAVVDLPRLRSRAKDNQLALTWSEHLGPMEGIETPTLHITEWLPIGSEIDLGGRKLRVLYTPGHTDDSISLLDTSNGLFFSGDFIYPGPLYAFLPNSSLKEYLEGSENLLRETDTDNPIFGAHRDSPPGIPTLSTADILDLQRTLISIRDGTATGEGLYPLTYKVNERIDLLTEPPWLQDWR